MRYLVDVFCSAQVCLFRVETYMTVFCHKGE
jgi:hypothetical protein